eukprot:SAG11_NODE_1356_length_5123_cov_2.002787_7_plen_62_part_00
MDRNDAGVLLGESKGDIVYEEALCAFRHNAKVYGEEEITLAAARGVMNMLAGYSIPNMCFL